MRRSTPFLLAAIATTAAWTLAVPAPNAVAQSQTPQAETPGSDRATVVSEEKLDAAAAVIEKTASIKETYQQRIEAAAPTDKERIADEANSAIAKAVTDQGLSIAEYTSILRIAQNDPTVRDKIIQRIRPDK
jgi:uncharacterized protein DUF4168